MSNSNQCHGCGGTGWVDTRTYGAQKCPLCHGSGVSLTFYEGGYSEAPARKKNSTRGGEKSGK